MKTKLLIGTLAALVILGLVGGVAFAAEPSRRLCGLGKVTAIDGDTITVENRRGTFDILTDADTVFRVKDVESPTIDDVNVGDIVAGQVEKQEDDTLLAKVVAVVPPKQQRVRGLGKVTAIDGDTITVENRRGTFDVLTDADTVFRVKDVESPTIDDVNVGDIVAGQVEKQEDGTILAKAIVVVPPQQ
jgi:exosome complex RNA-binding protein Csl4